MRVLVVGRAKTGTTALASLIRAGMSGCRLVMEPRSVLDFGPRSVASGDDEVIKIVHEQWNGRWRHLDALVHTEFGFPIDRVVFITRDVRDQMVSKLLYHAKIARTSPAPAGRLDEGMQEWVRVLKRKEQEPSHLSFEMLCGTFQELTGIDIWSAVTNVEACARYEHYIRTEVVRDHHVIAYEQMVRDDTGGLGAYLGRPLSSSLESVELGEWAYTKRSGRAGNWRSFFTDHDVAILRPIVSTWFDTGRYEDWELDTDPHVEPDECSRYVASIAGVHLP